MVPRPSSPTSLLWAHQLKREHAHILERMQAIGKASANRDDRLSAVEKVAATTRDREIATLTQKVKTLETEGASKGRFEKLEKEFRDGLQDVQADNEAVMLKVSDLENEINRKRDEEKRKDVQKEKALLKRVGELEASVKEAQATLRKIEEVLGESGLEEIQRSVDRLGDEVKSQADGVVSVKEKMDALAAVQEKLEGLQHTLQAKVAELEEKSAHQQALQAKIVELEEKSAQASRTEQRSGMLNGAVGRTSNQRGPALTAQPRTRKGYGRPERLDSRLESEDATTMPSSPPLDEMQAIRTSPGAEEDQVEVEVSPAVEPRRPGRASAALPRNNFAKPAVNNRISLRGRLGQKDNEPVAASQSINHANATARGTRGPRAVACIACRAVHRGCDRGNPCKHCVDSGKQCVYGTESGQTQKQTQAQTQRHTQKQTTTRFAEPESNAASQTAKRGRKRKVDQISFPNLQPDVFTQRFTRSQAVESSVSKPAPKAQEKKGTAKKPVGRPRKSLAKTAAIPLVDTQATEGSTPLSSPLTSLPSSPSPAKRPARMPSFHGVLAQPAQRRGRDIAQSDDMNEFLEKCKNWLGRG